MHAAIAVPGNSRTILTHVFGRGLKDDRHVVERFQAMADGNIRRCPGEEPAKNGRRNAKRTIASLKPAIVTNRCKIRALRGIGLLIHQSIAKSGSS